jgi:hypothetical protein
MSTWYLPFQADPRRLPTLDAVVSAVEAGIGTSLAVTRNPWSGNPRDFYMRQVRGVATLPIRVQADLAWEMSYDTRTAEDVDVARVMVQLDGREAAACDEVWSRLAQTLGALGYTDRTLEEAPAGIVDDLRAAGATARADTLRRDITAALIGKIQRQPPHWPLVVGFSRPDDLDRVLRSAPDPAQVCTISLSGCGLTALPAVLREAPATFPALEDLSLSHNPLAALPSTLRSLYPRLRRLDITSCAITLAAAEWEGVQVLTG